MPDMEEPSGTNVAGDGQSPVIKCVPGDVIYRMDEKAEPGSGCYVRGGYIHAAVAGFVVIEEEGNFKKVHVRRNPHGKSDDLVPQMGSIVTCKVTGLSPSHARCAIYCVEGRVLKHPFKAMIRKEDVRPTDKDTVEIYKCFRPGDIVLARAYGFGENHSYLLTTAESELGVVIAHSEAGVPMRPVSLTEMVCPQTLQKEPRKVAKVFITEKPSSSKS